METLIQAASAAREKAYAPYSGFKVGAAVLTKNGKIFSGCNIENASYGLTNCAERTAVFTAIAAGESEFLALAVIADTPRPTAPCGACRQVMAEFGIEKIIMCNLREARQVATIGQLLPAAFQSSDLTGDDKV